MRANESVAISMERKNHYQLHIQGYAMGVYGSASVAGQLQIYTDFSNINAISMECDVQKILSQLPIAARSQSHICKFREHYFYQLNALCKNYYPPAFSKVAKSYLC